MRGRKVGLKTTRGQSLRAALPPRGQSLRAARPTVPTLPKRGPVTISQASLSEAARASRARRAAGTQQHAGATEQQEAFRLFLLDHSTFSIAKALGTSPATILAWKKKGRWVAKRQTCFDNAETRVLRYIEEKNEDSLRRHNVIAVEMQRKGMEYLDHTPPETLAEVIRLLEIGVKMERSSRGMDAKGTDAGKIMDGLLSGDIIAAAVERQRVMLVRRTGPDSGPVYDDGDRRSTSEEDPDGIAREEAPPTP